MGVRHALKSVPPTSAAGGLRAVRFHKRAHRPGRKATYDPICKVCGRYYPEGTYGYHAKQPWHRAALVPKH